MGAPYDGGMATSINRADLLGNLGSDPEFRTLPDGAVVAQLRLATSRSWRNRDSGEWQEETEWHDVSVWRADHLRGRLRKGDRVHVTGRLRTRSWEHEGVTRRSTEIVCAAGAVILLTPRPDQAGGTAPYTEADAPVARSS